MVLVFVACIVTSKVLDICEAGHYWGDVNAIKSSKLSAINGDESEKRSIFYTYSCFK